MRPVAYHDQRFAGGFLIRQGLPDKGFRIGIQGVGGLIQQQNSCIAVKGPRQGNALPLPFGQGAAAESQEDEEETYPPAPDGEVRCQSCGEANKELATFCSQCSERL